MKRMLALFILIGLFGNWQLAFAGGPEVIERALSTDEAIRTAAIAELRALGPAGLKPLQQLREALQQEITAAAQAQAQSQSPRTESNLQDRLTRLEAAIDLVAGQRYACHSRLYWHTDLEQAKAAAVHANKPILSLRMLGNLTEDFSCANSRFFRTTLYANEEVSALLRDRFILHWKSVRPVPRVTIDFGDGRKLERTLTGNSIHYVLNAEGQILDALPGLYGPAAFIAQLSTSLDLDSSIKGKDATSRDQFLVTHHQQALARLDREWATEYQAAMQLLSGAVLADPRVALTVALPQPGQAAAEPPRAAIATRIAVPKSAVEAKLVKAAVPAETANPLTVTDERLWQVIAQLHAAEAKLDDASLKLIRAQNPVAAHAGRIARTKARVEDPVVRMVRSLESSIAIDTVRNEYQLHRQIHQWLAAAPSNSNVEQFNEQVYAQLFLTPSSDPWLGLAPIDSYTALPNGGVAGR